MLMKMMKFQLITQYLFSDDAIYVTHLFGTDSNQCVGVRGGMGGDVFLFIV